MAHTLGLDEVAAAVPNARVKLAYGTAGFRANAELLDAVFLRMGMLAALRSMQADKVVGVMVTASHNPIEDNGVKMIDTDGGMLARAWEAYATDIADAAPGGVGAVLAHIAAAEGIAWAPGAASGPCQPRVFLARDTRPSSAHLCSLARRGAEAMGAAVTDYGLLSTPQLHFIVRETNLGSPAAVASEAGYYSTLASAYSEILAGSGAAPAAVRGPLHLDCANGVGGPQARRLAAAMVGLVEVLPRNTGEAPAEAALLNDGCGAEHCQKARLPPSGFHPARDASLRCASLDGDADRLVYWYFDEAGAWHLLDGDKIASLAAVFVSEQLAALGWPTTGTPAHDHHHSAHHHAPPVAAAAGQQPPGGHACAPVSVGVVQTAYANGASSRYIRDALRLPVPLAKTGVKFVHHEALKYDVGVYFEANGHGTVLLHPSFLHRLQATDPASLPSDAARAARSRLLAASRLINQAIGDALSDAMFVEAVLALKDWDVRAWDAMYSDLPSRQSKLAVADRTQIATVEDETRVTQPAALQAAIDALVAAVPAGRAFVRPSGTEDVVRVYAEAATQEMADELAHGVALAAHRLAGGVGAAPSKVQ